MKLPFSDGRGRVFSFKLTFNIQDRFNGGYDSAEIEIDMKYENAEDMIVTAGGWSERAVGFKMYDLNVNINEHLNIKLIFDYCVIILRPNLNYSNLT